MSDALEVMQAHKTAFGANFIAADDTEVDDLTDFPYSEPILSRKYPSCRAGALSAKSSEK